MALIFATRPGGSGGGGGGLEITGFDADTFTQASNFSSGLALVLSNTPLAENSIVGDYNGQKIYPGEHFTLSGATVTILFGDADVTSYDTPPKFNFQYPY